MKRLKNKYWWLGVISLLILLFKQFGFDLTSKLPSDYTSIVNTIFLLLGMLGVSVDTSTEGLSDTVVTPITDTTNAHINEVLTNIAKLQQTPVVPSIPVINVAEGATVITADTNKDKTVL